MLFENQSFLSLGIADLVKGSVSWEDPEGEEPTQSITFRTNSTYFPPDYVKCFPTPAPSAAPTTVTEPPTQSPSNSPSVTVTPASADLGGLLAIILGVVAAIGTAIAGVVGFMILDDLDSSDDSKDHHHHHPRS